MSCIGDEESKMMKVKIDHQRSFALFELQILCSYYLENSWVELLVSPKRWICSQIDKIKEI
jgi:hypothetical protein